MKATIEQIKKIQKPYEKDPYHLTIFSRKFSRYFTWIFLRLDISSNMVTFLSSIFIFLGSYFFTFSDPLYWLLGWLVLQGYLVLDCSDGEVARLRKTTSKFGGMFDAMLHPLGNSVVFGAAAIGLYKLVANINILYFGFITVILLMMQSIIRLHAALITGKEKTYVLSKYTNRSTLKGKILALFMEVGGLFNMLVVVALIDYISIFDFSIRLYFYILFTIGIFLLLIKKLAHIRRDMK